MQLDAVHHIAIISSDYSRSRRFYVETLGLRVVHEAYRAERDSWKLDLAVGDKPGAVQIELFSFPAAPPRPSYPEACGLRHLAFAVPDITAAVSHLNRCGITTEPIRTDPYTGQRFTFFADPDGLPLELYER